MDTFLEMGRLVPIYKIRTSHLPSQNCILSKWCGLTFNVTYLTSFLPLMSYNFSYLRSPWYLIQISISGKFNPQLLFLILLINQLGQTSSKPLNVFRNISSHPKIYTASLFWIGGMKPTVYTLCSCVYIMKCFILEYTPLCPLNLTTWASVYAVSP